MPRRPLRPCAHPGCPGLVERGRCARHTRQRRKMCRPDYSRLYSTKRWRVGRRQFLAEHPWCAAQGCAMPATDVDHMRPHRGDKALFFDQTNWQPLCHACHSVKTHRETLGGGVGVPSRQYSGRRARRESGVGGRKFRSGGSEE